MPEWLSAYWVYIALLIGIILVVVLLIPVRSKQHIDIDDLPSIPKPTLTRTGSISTQTAFVSAIPPKSTNRDEPVDRDNLMVIKGTGAIFASRLDTAGIRKYHQIAAWTDRQVIEVAEHISVKVAKIYQDQWIEQAKLLAAERFEEFEAQYGKINPEEFNKFKPQPPA